MLSVEVSGSPSSSTSRTSRSTGRFDASTVAVFPMMPQSAGSVVPLMLMTSEAPAAITSHSQVRVPSVTEQASSATSSQSMLAGSASVMTTSYAAPGPLLVMVMVKLSLSPALTDSWSATFSISRSGQSTRMLSVELSGSLTSSTSSTSRTRFDASTVAVFSTVPQSDAAVRPLIVTTSDPPDAIVSHSQVRVPFVTEQASSRTASQSMFDGSTSVMTTLYAVPWPLLVIVIVKLSLSPALTESWSPTFSITRSGQSTTMLSVELSGSLTSSTSSTSRTRFDASTVAVFSTVPQSAGSVVPLIDTISDSPAAISSHSQVSVPSVTEQASSIVVSQSIFAGSTSVMTTSYAVPWPLFVIVIVKLILSPAFTDS